MDLNELSEVLSRVRQPEAEVWIRLRPPTMRETIGRELMTDAPPLSAELHEALAGIVDRDAEATWDHSTADLTDAAEQLVAMIVPVVDDPVEIRRAIAAWASEWSFS